MLDEAPWSLSERTGPKAGNPSTWLKSGIGVASLKVMVRPEQVTAVSNAGCPVLR